YEVRAQPLLFRLFPFLLIKRQHNQNLHSIHHRLHQIADIKILALRIFSKKSGGWLYLFPIDHNTVQLLFLKISVVIYETYLVLSLNKICTLNKAHSFTYFFIIVLSVISLVNFLKLFSTYFV